MWTSNLIGTVNPGVQCSVGYYSQTFAVLQADFNAWIDSAGSVVFILDSTDAVNPGACSHNDGYLILCYEHGTFAPTVSPYPTTETAYPTAATPSPTTRTISPTTPRQCPSFYMKLTTEVQTMTTDGVSVP
jgi:hypothetical protein